MSASYSDCDLSFVPDFTFSFVETCISQQSKNSGQKHISKGVVYYKEAYVHAITVNPTDGGCMVSAKCYHSQAKNQSPHQIKIEMVSDPVHIESSVCTCKVGLGGHCGHVCGVLYQLPHYKMQGIKAVPTDILKTSLKMSFHEPRGAQIPGKRIDDLEVKGHSKRLENPLDVSARVVKSNLYDAIGGQVPILDDLTNAIENAYPSLPILSALKLPTEPLLTCNTVTTKFGKFHKGSVLGVQQKLQSDISLNIYDGVGFPDLPAKNVMINEYNAILDQKKNADFQSIFPTYNEGLNFQELTTAQSGDPLWFKLGENRITASKIGRIRSIKDNFEKLVCDLKSTRKTTTKAMQRGVECEPLAANTYVELNANNVNLYPSGVVVSPYSPWLAASPDRKVYYPTRTREPFGLLEIKCPDVSSVLEVSYIKKDKTTGHLRLNPNHEYFYQIQMQLAVTGLPWCDLFVWTANDDNFHLETIHFDSDLWQMIKNKADIFYFEHFL